MSDSATLATLAVAEADATDPARAFWTTRLAGDQRPAGLRTDHPRPEERCPASATATFEIAGETFERLARLTGGEPFLEYAALVAALTGCLFRYSQVSPVAVGCPPLRGDGEAPAPNAIVVRTEVDGQ